MVNIEIDIPRICLKKLCQVVNEDETEPAILAAIKYRINNTPTHARGQNMKQVEFTAGKSINEACDEIYDRALHREFLYFDFNGVRVSMYPKLLKDSKE